MTTPILVTGGTGTLGRIVVPLLREAGRDVRVLTRSAREPATGVEYVTGDLATGDGVDAAVAGIGTVVHLAGGAKGDDDKARTLMAAATKAGVTHVVYISVVGADRPAFAYFEAKGAGERVIAESGIPWTTLRATQFHDLILTVGRFMAKLPVIPVPSGFRFQPVDARDVAARLVELTLGAPAGLVPDIAGPRVYEMKDLIRDYLTAAGKHRPILPIRLPGKGARAFRAGVNVAPDHATGRRTWEDFVAERVPTAEPRLSV